MLNVHKISPFWWKMGLFLSYFWEPFAVLSYFWWTSVVLLGTFYAILHYKKTSPSPVFCILGDARSCHLTCFGGVGAPPASRGVVLLLARRGGGVGDIQPYGVWGSAVRQLSSSHSGGWACSLCGAWALSLGGAWALSCSLTRDSMNTSGPWCQWLPVSPAPGRGFTT